MYDKVAIDTNHMMKSPVPKTKINLEGIIPLPSPFFQIKG